MGERCIILADEFMESGIDKQYILENSEMSVKEIISEIIDNERFSLTVS